MSFGFGFGFPSWRTLAGGFSPAALFVGGVPGAWYDPSDLSTLFDSSTGTTPVSMPGQGAPVPVGLMLDKSQNGVGTNGAKRVNLLTFTEQFDNAAWTKPGLNAFGAGSVANTTATLDPLGGNTADYIQENSANAPHYVFSNGGISVNAATYQGFVYAKAAERSRLVMGIWNNTNYELCQFDLTNGVILQEATPGIASIENAGNGWWKCGVSRTIGATTTYLSFGPYINANISTLTGPWTNAAYTGNGTSGIYIWGADLRLASEANTQPTYQRITDTWYSTLPGNHAIAFNNTTARPELRARVNLLTYSEEFDNGAWTRFNLNAFGSGSVANTTATLDPLGGNTADYIQENTANNQHAVYNTTALSLAATQHTASIYAKAAERNWLVVNLNTGGGDNRTWFDLSNGTVGTNAAGNTAQIVDFGNGWYRCSVTRTTATGNSYFQPQIANADGSFSYTGDGTSGIYIWGADLRPANIGANVPAYQRIADANTYDTSGFPLYLRFDGIDDSMYTPANLNLSGTDKVAVFAGVRKNADVVGGQAFTELSSSFGSNNGSFGLLDVGAPNYTPGFGSRGTATAYPYPASGYSAPLSMVLTGIGNIAAPLAQIRANGSVAASSAASQGTGNYGTYPLYIGDRNSTSLRLNGHIYSLAVVGSAVSGGNIAAMESWVAGKTGIAI